MSETRALAAADLEPGSAVRVTAPAADGTLVSVAIVRNADGDVFALSDTCSHGDASLSLGEVDDGEIECFAHGGRFDLATGRPTCLPALEPVRAFHVRLDGDDILVDVDAPPRQKENR